MLSGTNSSGSSVSSLSSIVNSSPGSQTSMVWHAVTPGACPGQVSVPQRILPVHMGSFSVTVSFVCLQVGSSFTSRQNRFAPSGVQLLSFVQVEFAIGSKRQPQPSLNPSPNPLDGSSVSVHPPGGGGICAGP